MVNQKRILLMYWHDFEKQDTGESVRIYSIMKLLHDNGYIVDLYALTEIMSNFKDFNNKKITSNLYTYSFQDVDRSFKKDRLSNFVTPRMVAQFHEIITQNDYDFIATVYLAQADLLKYFISDKCKKIYLFEDDLALAESYNGKNVGVLIDDQIRKLKYFDEVVYISGDEKIFYEKFIPNIKSTLVHGLFPIKNINENSQKKYDILFVGHDNPHNIEGVEWFLDWVYPLLNPDVLIRIVGKVSTLTKRNISNVSFAGFVENLEDEYNSAKITICPLKRGTGMKIKVLEAMAHGLPSVVTIRGADGFLDKTEFGSFVTDDPQEFAKYIHILLSDLEIYKEMSEKSFNYFKKHLSYEANKDTILKTFICKSGSPKIKRNVVAENMSLDEIVKLKVDYHLPDQNKKNQNTSVSIYVNKVSIGTCDKNSLEFTAHVPYDLINKNIFTQIEFIQSDLHSLASDNSKNTKYRGLYIKSISLERNGKVDTLFDFSEWDINCHLEGFSNNEDRGRWIEGPKASVSFIYNHPKISVIIISSNNNDEHFERIIKSVHNTKYSNLECIVMDISGSRSIAKIADLLRDKITYFEQINGTYAQALNVSLEKVSGNFVCMLDSTDSISADYFSNALKALSKSGAQYTTSPGYSAGKHSKEIPCGELGEVAVFGLNPCRLSGMLLSSDIFKKIYGFDEKLKHAFIIDFQLKILLNCQFKGVKSSELAQYYSNEPYINKPEKAFIEELISVMERYHPEYKKETIDSLLQYVICGSVNERIVADLSMIYRNDFYSNTQKLYLKKIMNAKGLQVYDDNRSLEIENEQLYFQLENIKDNKWYRFGLLSRKEKVKKIFAVLYKRFKNKLSRMKRIPKVSIISKNMEEFNKRKANNNINLLYDTTFLVNGAIKGANRTGIFFVAYNLLEEFYKHNNVSVYLYCEPEHLNATEQFLKSECINNGKIEFINKNSETFIAKLTEMDVFFSPMHKIPDDVAQIKDIAKFTVIHDTIPYIFPDFFPDMKRNDYWFKHLMNGINKTDYYFATSMSTKNDILRFSNAEETNIFVTYWGTSENFYHCDNKMKIDEVKRKYNIPLDKRYVFSLCTIEPRKNLIFAVKGFIEFIKKHDIKDLIFVMGGTQWDFFISKLEAEIKGAKDYLPYILRIGYVDDEDLSPLYSDSEMTIYPSLYEGFGLPILEAMSCGTPVITSNVSSCPEVAGDAALTIDPHNIEELVAAIEKIYFDKTFREDLCEKGIARSKTFSWKKTSSYMVEIMLQAAFNKQK